MKITLKTPTGEVVAFNPSEIIVEGENGDVANAMLVTHAGAHTVRIPELTVRTIGSVDTGLVIGDYSPAWMSSPNPAGSLTFALSKSCQNCDVEWTQNYGNVCSKCGATQTT